MTDAEPLSPVIVAPACDRPASLARLLGSLARIDRDEQQITLVISIDGGDTATLDVARRFDWPHGIKRIIRHPERLGLLRHILACGDLVHEYGAILMLEDDLYVSAQIHRYARTAVTAYQGDDRVGGISTYAYRVDDIAGMPFLPLQEEYDTFFLQFPSSWGQIWTRDQWRAFSEWMEHSAAAGVLPSHGVPDSVAWWSEKSWKKFYARYLIETKRTFVYPYRALSSNCCDSGVHMKGREMNPMTPLVRGCRDWRFAPLEPAAIAYDAWFEPTPATLASRWPELGLDDVDVDLRGTKSPWNLSRDRLLSLRPCSRPEAEFPLVLLPLEENLALPGERPSFFALGARVGRKGFTRSQRSRLFQTMSAQITPKHAEHILAESRRA
jgi:hypothetical protein